MNDSVNRAIYAVWRIESARLIAGLARITRDVGAAEELASAALVTALEKWPVTGIPDKPGAWLMATAKNRAFDQLRFRTMRDKKHQQIAHEADEAAGAEDAAVDRVDDDVGDDLLRLIFTACHPVLAPDVRAALTLRLVGGLTTDEIARAFVVSPTTMAQRLVRAKATLREANVAFAVPQKAERAARLSSVLEVLYLIFNEGYSASAGDDWVRPDLCTDALRLARVLAGLCPHESEVQGLVALLEIQASRLNARVDKTGAPVLLLEQDRNRWDRLLIRRGLNALVVAESLVVDGDPRGPYLLQAAIAACHGRAQRAADTDWVGIATLYGELAERLPSPIVELNRAVAVGRAFGAAAGLAIVDAVAADLDCYHLLPSVRGDLLFTLGRTGEAQVAFEQAAALTQNARERGLLLRRAASCRAELDLDKT